MSKPPLYIDQVYAKSCSDMAELPDASVDLVVTSPPYEAMRSYSDHPEDLGNAQGPEFVGLMRKPVAEIHRVLKPAGSAFVNFQHQNLGGFASPTLYLLPALYVEQGFHIVQVLYWIKTNAHPQNDPRLLKTAVEPIYQLAKTKDYYANKDAIRRPSLHAGKDKRTWKYNPMGADPGSFLCPAIERLRGLSVQDVLLQVLDPEGSALPYPKSQDQATVHPAKMPEELARWLVLYGSRPGALVLDPFLGSGTTACMAKALGRRFVGYELNPEYASLARRRLAQIQPGDFPPTEPIRMRAPRLPERPSGLQEAFCPVCGTPFIPNKPWQKFCSAQCRYKHHNAGRKHDPEKTDAQGSSSASQVPPQDALRLDQRQKDTPPQGGGEAPVR